MQLTSTPVLPSGRRGTPDFSVGEGGSPALAWPPHPNAATAHPSAPRKPRRVFISDTVCLRGSTGERMPPSGAGATLDDASSSRASGIRAEDDRRIAVSFRPGDAATIRGRVVWGPNARAVTRPLDPPAPVPRRPARRPHAADAMG